MFKDWNLIWKEGEELPPPVPEVSVPAAGGKAAPKKADDKKKAPPPKKGAIEVITDNNPWVISCYQEIGTAENQISISEDYVRKICSTGGLMSLTLIDTNPETLEETVLDSLSIDISGLVFPDKAHTLTWTFDNLKFKKVNYLKLSLSSGAAFLSDFYRKKLNPL